MSQPHHQHASGPAQATHALHARDRDEGQVQKGDGQERRDEVRRRGGGNSRDVDVAAARAPRGGIIVPREDRIIQAGAIHLLNVSPPAGQVIDPAAPEYALHLMLRADPLLRVGFNRRPRWLAVSPGSLLPTPPDTACEFIAESPAHVLTVAMPKALVEDFTRDAGLRIDVREEALFRDARLAQHIIALWHAVSSDAPAGPLLADQTTRTLLAALAQRSLARDSRAGTRAADSRTRAARERLANHTVRRLRDYIESSLAEELDVTRMAEVAALSPAHFARAFAATVGMTPFSYVMTRRLARARDLLERTERSMLDIALDVGFKTPSHFAARFRREFGVTPRDLRRPR